MIPKILHYCWFGGKPLPETAKICIESWKRNCPDFEIMEWNEDNFDINSHQFVKECYEAKKFGFIVDVLRTYVLKEYGGIYLDTDTQIIKPFSDELLNLNAFLSYEDKNYPNVGFIASEKNGKLVNQVYNLYKDKHFLKKDGTINNSYTGPIGFAEILEKNGISLDGDKKSIDGYVSIYPQEYFCAKSYSRDEILVTYNTYAIHHYDASWHSQEEKNNFEKQLYSNRLKNNVNHLKNHLNNAGIFTCFKEAINLSYFKLFIILIKTTLSNLFSNLKK